MMREKIPRIGSNTASEVKKRDWRYYCSIDYKTCSGSPSALGGLLTSCLPAAFGPTVFDCLAEFNPPAQRSAPRCSAGT